MGGIFEAGILVRWAYYIHRLGISEIWKLESMRRIKERRFIKEGDL